MLGAKPYFLQAPVIPNHPACEKGFLAPLTQQLFVLQAQSSTGSTNSGLWGAVWIACVQKQARKSVEGGINLIPSHCRAKQITGSFVCQSRVGPDGARFGFGKLHVLSWPSPRRWSQAPNPTHSLPGRAAKQVCGVPVCRCVAEPPVPARTPADRSTRA